MKEFFKRLFHFCNKFQWTYGYGFIRKGGLGGYEFEFCSDCGKPSGRIKNFKAEKGPTND